jgi:hypothetical protein
MEVSGYLHAPDALLPRKKFHNAHCIGDRVDLKCSGHFEEEKNLLPMRGIELLLTSCSA